MALKLSYCRYRLLFKHPFGTAHGLRDGTDSVFIRAEQDGFIGYGEATLPPYLEETVDSVIQRIEQVAGMSVASAGELMDRIVALDELFEPGPGARAALHMALLDILSKLNNNPVIQIDRLAHLKSSVTLMTVGSGRVEDIADKLKDTWGSTALKVKLGSPNDMDAIRTIKDLDQRMLFLDANQGLSTVQEALDRIACAGPKRVLGMEQPFPKDRTDLHAALKAATEVPIYGDESIQGVEDLESKSGSFNGVNIKLMKCGGLDRVKEMIDRANELGLKVMLGSMSESSLGCTAMAHFAGRAEVVDLDGPWLIRNDPFQGMTMRDGILVLPEGPGFGVTLKAHLDWTPIGA